MWVTPGLGAGPGIVTRIGDLWGRHTEIRCVQHVGNGGQCTYHCIYAKMRTLASMSWFLVVTEARYHVKTMKGWWFG